MARNDVGSKLGSSSHLANGGAGLDVDAKARAADARRPDGSRSAVRSTTRVGIGVGRTSTRRSAAIDAARVQLVEDRRRARGSSTPTSAARRSRRPVRRAGGTPRRTDAVGVAAVVRASARRWSTVGPAGRARRHPPPLRVGRRGAAAAPSRRSRDAHGGRTAAAAPRRR